MEPGFLVGEKIVDIFVKRVIGMDAIRFAFLSFRNFSFLKNVFIYLLGHAGSSVWHVGSSFPTRDQTWAPCTGNAQSRQVGHQGSPGGFSFFHGILVVNPPTSKNAVVGS